jgi:hypothetical protein
VDRSSLAGDLYAAVASVEAPAEPILERLNDPAERYLPLAYGDRHYLLNKTSILCVELEQMEDPGVYDPGNAERRFPVEVLLASGAKIRGVVHAPNDAAYRRTLDTLNAKARGFLRVARRPGIVYVNHDHVVAVYDVVER